MNQYMELIMKSPLFCGISSDDLEKMCKEPLVSVKKYSRGSYIFEEGDTPFKLYILLDGHVSICRHTIMGRKLIIADIDRTGDLFGEVYLFMEQKQYDMGAEALEDSSILVIDKSIFLNGEYSYVFNHNMMAVFANKAYALSGKVRLLGCDSIREKIVRYIISRQNTEGQLDNDISRETMANLLNVARPSLSRELGKMADEGIITIKKRKIIILDQKKLEEFL